MGKKKNKKSSKEYLSKQKLDRAIESTAKDVKKHKVIDVTPDPHLMEYERGLSRCDQCISGEFPTPICLWYKDNNCTGKCHGFHSSLHTLRFADSKKIKVFDTPGEISLEKKLRKYLPLAVKLDDELVEIEAAEALKKRKARIAAELDKLEKEVEEPVKEPTTKRRNLKSLI